MATTEELIAVFRLTIPAMANVSDAELALDFDIYGDYVSERRFGKLYGKALSFFVAHMRTLNTMIASAGNDAGDATLTAGRLTSEKEGQLQRNYDSSGSSGTDADSLLQKTIYGQQFLLLRDMVISSVTIRTGGGCCGRC